MRLEKLFKSTGVRDELDAVSLKYVTGFSLFSRTINSKILSK